VLSRIASSVVFLWLLVASCRRGSAPDPPSVVIRERVPSQLLIAVVLTFTLVTGAATYFLVRHAGPPNQPQRPTGGLLVLTNGGRASSDADDVAVQVTISDTGFPGDDRIEVMLSFAHPRPGLRWTLVASGQYAVPRRAPVDAFCRAGAVDAGNNDVECPADVYKSSPVVIHGHREIAATSRDGIFKIHDYDGYQPGAASTISGGLPSDAASGTDPVIVAWPIRDIKTAKGGSTTWALAPIAANDYEYGSSATRVSSRDLSSRAQFADAVTLQPLNQALVAGVSLKLQDELGFQDIAEASPQTESADRLAWSDPAMRDTGIHYVLHDPIRAGDLLRRTFIGGVLGGLAVSLFLWAVQLIIERRTATRRVGRRGASVGTG
jgi:hypothetical protein